MGLICISFDPDKQWSGSILMECNDQMDSFMAIHVLFIHHITSIICYRFFIIS